MIKETMEFLSQYDPEVGATIEKEYHRQQRNIELIASENIVSPAASSAKDSDWRLRSTRPATSSSARPQHPVTRTGRP